MAVVGHSWATIDIPVEVYIGGDYKFLLLLGMKSATSDHACIWCKIHKNARSDMSKPKDFYWESLARSITEIQTHARSSKCSCAHQPLINIPLENVVLDELHLMLRITDKLTTNLVMEMQDWDREDNLNKRPIDRTNMHMDSLIKAINSCGVSFNVWQKMDGNGRESGLLDFTSLMGSDKKLLLQKLPSKLENVVKPETLETVIKLWKDFCELYKLLQMQDPRLDKILDYFNKATRWVNLFTSLGGIRNGYEMARVTPYVHAMVYHVPRFLEKHQGIKRFTGQGVEKLNDDCRRVHLQRSNKWDAAKDVLLVGKRVKHLAFQSYWETGILESRTKRQRIGIVNPGEPNATDLDSLSLEEI
ncbi:Hypothetical predicted protein [Paramuricea clavata]|uniref:Uncharacterized protein n=1 Tax=Paramuricea clavata TaxID=317549 RepID=A0A6S7GDS5_PARCT|nr:Hypothetical predicted protein [Paramuricea clavata]